MGRSTESIGCISTLGNAAEIVSLVVQWISVNVINIKAGRRIH